MIINKYQNIQNYFTKKIQKGQLPIGSYLPSEHEICEQFGTTRTTVRRALDELLKAGFIKKEKGRGSRIVEWRKSLGLLTVKGFSESLKQNKKTVVLQEPITSPWSQESPFALTEKEQLAKAAYFQRLRFADNEAVMLEHNWYSLEELPLLKTKDFVDGSFFKTLSQRFLIEIKGTEQELRAEKASPTVAKHLNISEGSPILHISLRFTTSRPGLHLYSEVYCNTNKYPITNRYFL